MREYQRKGGMVSGEEAIMGGWWLGPLWPGPVEEDMGSSLAHSSTASPCSHWGRRGGRGGGWRRTRGEEREGGVLETKQEKIYVHRKDDKRDDTD